MRNIIFVLFLFNFLWLSGQTNYYISPAGSNTLGDGTIGNPWATWQKGFESAEAGDTVYIRGGVYSPLDVAYQACVVYINPNDGINSVGHDGTRDLPICIFNYPGEKPILDCKNVDYPAGYPTGLGLDRINFWHIKGLTVINVLQPTPVTVHGIIMGYGSNCTFENLTVQNIGGKGILCYNYFQYTDENDSCWYPEQLGIVGDTIRYINCDASYCMDSIGRGGVDYGNYSDGFWMNIQDTMSCVIMDGCRSWMNSDDGFDLPTRGVMKMNNCWAWNNGHLVSGGGNGIRNDPMSNKLDMPWTTKNCLAAFNKNSGFTVGYPGDYERPTYWYNNLSYDNDYGVWIYGQDTTQGRVIRTVRNNVLFGNHTFDALIAIIPQTYSNNFLGNVESLGIEMNIPDHNPQVFATVDDFVSLDSTLLVSPRNSDGSLPNINFGKLVQGSDLIGAGVNVGMSLNPDMGVDWSWLGRGVRRNSFGIKGKLGGTIGKYQGKYGIIN